MTDFTISLTSIASIAGVVSIVAGAWLKVRRVLKDRNEAKIVERAIIIQEAKEISAKNKAAVSYRLDLLEADLNNKLKALSEKILALEESTAKEIGHVKESYNSELRFLGSKIEELKDEMRGQMGQIVQLVSKLIDKT